MKFFSASWPIQLLPMSDTRVLVLIYVVFPLWYLNFHSSFADIKKMTAYPALYMDAGILVALLSGWGM